MTRSAISRFVAISKGGSFSEKVSDCCGHDACPDDYKELSWSELARPLLIRAPAPPSCFCTVCAGNCRMNFCSCSVPVPSCEILEQSCAPALCLSLLWAPRAGWPFPPMGGRRPSAHLRGRAGLMWQGWMNDNTERIFISEDEPLLAVVSTKA